MILFYVWLGLVFVSGYEGVLAEDDPYQEQINQLLGWQHLEVLPMQDRINYWKLMMHRQQMALHPNLHKNKTKSEEAYEKFELEKLINDTFRTKPPHLMTSEERYIQFIKDKFYKIQKGKNPQTSREKYERFMKDKMGEVFGGWPDLKNNYIPRSRRHALRPDNVDWKSIRNKELGEVYKSLKRVQRQVTTQKVVDYLNERAVQEHDLECARRYLKDPFEESSHRPRAYYTSEEHLKPPYSYNERAYQERQRNKWVSYQDYVNNEEARLKPKAYYFTDPARYVNKPRPKQKGEQKKARVRRNAKSTPKHTTWRAVHYSFNDFKDLKFNFSEELLKQMASNVPVQYERQQALEATGQYKLKDKLGPNQTIFRLPTFRNFVKELTYSTIVPYTFKKNPMDDALAYMESGIHIPSAEITLPNGEIRDWIRPQLASYRKGYIGLTEREPFAHYPEYSWENEGFDMGKLEDPFAPIWPLDKVKYQVDLLRKNLDPAPENTEAPYDPSQWRDDGKEITTNPGGTTRRIIIPVI